MTKIKIEELPGLSEMLDVFPSQFENDAQNTMCDLMDFVVLPTDVPDEERDHVRDKCAGVVAHMHEAMHNGPRVGGLMTLNCLVMLDIMMRNCEPSAEKRMRVYAELLANASKVATMHVQGLAQGERGKTKH